jgi:hypothetical protein
MDDLSEVCETVEELIDKHTLARVVEALAYVCFMKAVAVRVTRRDARAARAWDRAARTRSG